MSSTTNNNAMGVINLLHVTMRLLFPVVYGASSSVSCSSTMFSLCDVIILSPLANAVSILNGADLACLFFLPHDTFSEKGRTKNKWCKN